MAAWGTDTNRAQCAQAEAAAHLSYSIRKE